MPRALPSQNLAAREFGHAEGTRVERLSEAVIEAGWLVILALAPLFMNPYSARSYEPDKTVLVRSIALLMFAAWTWKVLSGGRAYVPGSDSGSMRDSRAVRPVATLLRVPLLAPALVLALFLVVGSLLSIDSRLSWFGSYPRFQGAWAQLSYILVFGLVVAHLRHDMQWRRISFVIIMTSFLVSLYAVLQVLGLDPLPSAIGWSRAFSTLGNPIFLAAYLLMVIFITLFELLRLLAAWWASPSADDTSPLLALQWKLGSVSLLAVLLLQTAAVVLSQSRGPFLGLLAGGYVFTLILALTLHGWARGTEGLARGTRGLLRWAWLGVIALGVLGLVFLIVFTMPGSPLEPLHDVPYLGRLGTILNFESNTAQVRLLIWQGAVELLGSDAPLHSPGGKIDRVQSVRDWIGFGPETFSLAFNPFYPPELGQREGRGDAPDRAHNETLDALVMQGWLGYAAWLAVYCGLFYVCLKQLRLIRNSWQQVSFWLNLALGALFGTLAPFQLTGSWALSGVGLPAGLIMGLIVYVTLEALLDRAGRSGARRLEARDGLVMAILAAVVAHVVEIHFGIAILATRLYFWFLAGVVVCVSCGWLSLEADEVVSESESSPADKSKKGKRREQRPYDRSRPVATSLERAQRWSLYIGLILGLLGATISYGLSLNHGRSARGLEVLIDGLMAKAGGGPAWLPGALLWLIVSLSFGICLAWVFGAGLSPSGRALSVGALTAGLGLGFLYSLVQAGRAAWVVRVQRESGALSPALGSVVNHVVVYFGFALLVVLLIALVIGWRRRDPWPMSRRSTAWTVLSLLVLVGGVSCLIVEANLRPIQADTYLKHAKALIGAGRPEAALDALALATRLEHHEPMNFLVLGRAAVEAAKRAETDDERERRLALAEGALTQARKLAPLDPDHSANLARYHVSVADLARDPARAGEARENALRGYEVALALRPSSVLFINEYALLLLRMDEIERAESLLVRALDLDPQYAVTLSRLGTVHQQKAAGAQQAGDRSETTRQLEEAVAFYERALLIDPEMTSALQALDRIRPVLYRYQGSPPSRTRLRELYGDDWRTHQSMARMHLDEGRRDRASAHQSLAEELGSAPGERQSPEN